MKKIYLTLAFLCISPVCFSQSRNTVNLESRGDLQGLAILDTAVEGAQVILNGEIHGVESDTKVQLKMLEYLSSKERRVVLIGEYSNSYAHFINQYLLSGDTTYLRAIMYEYGMNSDDDFQLYMGLRMLNQGLPSEKQVQLLGIDMEYMSMFGKRWVYWALNQIIGNKQVPAIIQPELIAFLDLSKRDTVTKKELQQKSEGLLKSIQQHSTDYSTFLSSDLPIFQQTVSNLVATFSAFKGYVGGKSRDKWMYQNFSSMHKQSSDQQNSVCYYGSFGSGHVGNWNKRIFAARLNRTKDSPFKGKVLSIVPCYVHCMGPSWEGTEPLDFCVSDEPPEVLGTSERACLLKKAIKSSEKKNGEFRMSYYNYPATRYLASNKHIVVLN